MWGRIVAFVSEASLHRMGPGSPFQSPWNSGRMLLDLEIICVLQLGLQLYTLSSRIFQRLCLFTAFKKKIYLFLAVLDLRFCARAFSSCVKRGPLFIAVRGPLTIAASLVAEHRLQTLRLGSFGSRASLLRGMWDLPGPGLEPVSPALAGRFSTTAPPGKPHGIF